MATDSEIAWAAGLFEGEGCIHLGVKGSSLVVASTDRDVLERFAAIVECGRIRQRDRRHLKPHYKDAYEWRVASWADRERVLRALLPWLGERRRAKAEEMLAVPLTYGRNLATCRAGLHPWVPENIYEMSNGWKQCRACRRASSARHKKRVRELRARERAHLMREVAK